MAAAINQIDKNSDGKLTYDEFIQWWKLEDRFEKLKLSDENHAALTAASQFFHSFDHQHMGSISKQEFPNLYIELKDIGFQLGDLDEGMAEFDLDEDGFISFSEYVAWLKRQGVFLNAEL